MKEDDDDYQQVLQRLRDALGGISTENGDNVCGWAGINTKDITDEQYLKLVSKMECKSFKANEHVCKSNELTNPALYLVLDGKARLTKSGGGNDASWLKKKGSDDGDLNSSFASLQPTKSSDGVDLNASFATIGGAPASPRRAKGRLSAASKPVEVTMFGEDLLVKAEFRKTKGGKLIQNLITAPYSVRVGSKGCKCAVLTAHAFREALHVGREGEDDGDDNDAALLQTPKAKKEKVTIPTTPKSPKSPRTPKASKPPVRSNNLYYLPCVSK